MDALNRRLGPLKEQLKAAAKARLNDRGADTPLKAWTRKGMLAALGRGIGIWLPFAPRNGFKVLDLSDGYIRAGIPLKGNQNHFGGMYAGALFLVAEIPGGLLPIVQFDSRFYPLLKELRMEFLKVAKTDITVEFRLPPEEVARIERVAAEAGKCDFELVGELRDRGGEVVARSHGSYQIRLKQPKQA